MAGAFSGHLADSFLTSQQYARGAFGQPLASSISGLPLTTSGPMSFAPSMHGTMASQSFSFEPSFMDLSEETAKRIATLQAKLDKKLGPEYISQRPGPGGGPKLTYAEGWKIINLANEIFGFNGWSSSVVNLTVDFIDCQEETKRYNVGVTAVVRITLRDGVHHEDVGYGLLENSKSKGAALDKCKKEAVTDAVKRALRNFGNVLGNCLYDKSYTQEIVKIKVPPPKFNKDDLHRRPEFDESKSNAAPSTSASHTSPNLSTSTPAIKQEPPTSRHPVSKSTPAPNQRIAHTAGPSHLRNVTGPPAVVQPPVVKREEPVRPGGVGISMPVTPANASATPRAGFQQNQGQDLVSRPPQQPPQTDRRVSFALASAPAAHAPIPASDPPIPKIDSVKDIPPLEEEDSFKFDSEDDAFFAGVDLGEEGLGGPIDFDEGVSRADGNAGLDRSTEIRKEEPPPKQQTQAQPQEPMQPQRPPQQQSRPAPPPVQHQQNRPPQAPQRLPVFRPGAQQGVPAQQDSARKASATPTSSGNASGTRTPTSSGGFHFPPGVNPQNVRSGPPGSVSRPQNVAAGSGIGLKRTADVMQDRSTARRPAQGMGLAPHSSGSGWSTHQGQGARREPLGALEVGEGGDVKRLRR